MDSDSRPFATRAALDRQVDHACTLRARALASGEAWVATGGLFADALAPVLGLLRRARRAVGEQPGGQSIAGAD